MARKKSPTQRSLAELRSKGFIAEVVEHWNPWARLRKDLWGFTDIVAVHPGRMGTTFVQTTTASHQAERLKKIIASPYTKIILKAGNDIVVHGWHGDSLTTTPVTLAMCEVA